MPTLAALLADAPWQCDSYLCPILGSITHDKLGEEFVFLLRPVGTDHMTSICEFEVPFVAFNFRLPEYFANAVPALITMLLHVLKQEFVLKRGERVRWV